MAATVRQAAAAPLGPIRSGLKDALHRARTMWGINYGVWPQLFGVPYNTCWRVWEGRATATHANLMLLSRLAAILDVPTSQVCDHALPPCPWDQTLADLDRLAELTGPFTRSFLYARGFDIRDQAAPQQEAR